MTDSQRTVTTTLPTGAFRMCLQLAPTCHVSRMCFINVYHHMQVLVSHNQLQLPPDPADSTPAAAAAGQAKSPSENKARGSSPRPKRPRRAPIPAPAPDSSLRYMLVAVPDVRGRETRDVLSHHEVQGVMGALADQGSGGVIVQEVPRVQYFLDVLREQL